MLRSLRASCLVLSVCHVCVFVRLCVYLVCVYDTTDPAGEAVLLVRLRQRGRDLRAPRVRGSYSPVPEHDDYAWEAPGEDCFSSCVTVCGVVCSS